MAIQAVAGATRSERRVCISCLDTTARPAHRRGVLELLLLPLLLFQPYQCSHCGERQYFPLAPFRFLPFRVTCRNFRRVFLVLCLTLVVALLTVAALDSITALRRP